VNGILKNVYPAACRNSGRERIPAMSKTQKSLLYFLLITFVFSAAVEAVIIITKRDFIFSGFLMWMPALAAYLSNRFTNEKQKGGFGFKKCRIRYLLQGVFIPLVYLGIPYLLLCFFFPAKLAYAPTRRLLVVLAIGIPLSMLTALGEEIGWRGFMLPRLVSIHGIRRALFASSLIWYCWHLPILLADVYLPGLPILFKAVMFLINIGSVGIIIGIITLRSGSVWPAAVLHAAHNAYDQLMFGPYTVGDSKLYFISESGILTSVLTVSIAVILYTFYRRECRRKGIWS